LKRELGGKKLKEVVGGKGSNWRSEAYIKLISRRPRKPPVPINYYDLQRSGVESVGTEMEMDEVGLKSYLFCIFVNVGANY